MIILYISWMICQIYILFRQKKIWNPKNSFLASKIFWKACDWRKVKKSAQKLDVGNFDDHFAAHYLINQSSILKFFISPDLWQYREFLTFCKANPLRLILTAWDEAKRKTCKKNKLKIMCVWSPPTPDLVCGLNSGRLAQAIWIALFHWLSAR